MRHFLDLYFKKGMPSPFSLKTWQEVQIDELRKRILQLHLDYILMPGLQDIYMQSPSFGMF
jgi:hypothetical protein